MRTIQRQPSPHPGSGGASPAALDNLRLRIHIQHRNDGTWFVDIDDDADRQPDDPYWCQAGCRDHSEAIAAGCSQLRIMAANPTSVRQAGRISGWRDDLGGRALAA